LADDIVTDDRRRVVNAGVRFGRDAVLAELSSFVDIGACGISSDVIATRGERLILNRSEILGENQRPHEIDSEVLDIIEIDSAERIIARVVFDPDDLNAAFEELDARYLAGEAAAHARTWSVIAKAYVGINAGELAAMTRDWTMVDHRLLRARIDAENAHAYLRAGFDLTPNFMAYVESVHRLSDRGVVISHAGYGTSQDGIDVEWHDVNLSMVTGDYIDHCELFDEADLESALDTFDQLNTPLKKGSAARIGDT
jgi:hypothetical protein